MSATIAATTAAIPAVTAQGSVLRLSTMTCMCLDSTTAFPPAFRRRTPLRRAWRQVWVNTRPFGSELAITGSERVPRLCRRKGRLRSTLLTWSLRQLCSGSSRVGRWVTSHDGQLIKRTLPDATVRVQAQIATVLRAFPESIVRRVAKFEARIERALKRRDAIANSLRVATPRHRCRWVAGAARWPLRCRRAYRVPALALPDDESARIRSCERLRAGWRSYSPAKSGYSQTFIDARPS